MSAINRTQVFSAVHTIGGLLPADMLVRISEGKDVDGSRPADYGAVVSRSVQDEAERHWDYTPSIGLMKQLVGDRMYPLTIDGLEKAMKELSR